MGPSSPTALELRSADEHPFVRRPRRVFFTLSVPVFFSLVAEPITALVDTAFVKELGAAPLAGLGAGTIVLSSTFWIFNFLGIGTQTEVARLLGADDRKGARSIVSLALALGSAFGVVLALVLGLGASELAAWMGGEGGVHADAATYIRLRALGAPAVILMSVGFGALRGLQEMRVPMWIAIGANLVNILFDWLLIFGHGPFPALGVAGAAWATVGAQWLGALWAVVLVGRRLGWTRELRLRDAHLLLVIGFDLFLRTGLLSLFLVLGTRAATRASGAGGDAGAAHQAIRNVWLFAALALDAFAATAQSLIGYFRGAGERALMRKVARVACEESLAMGTLIALLMLLGADWVANLLVPESARALFHAAWWVAAISQPLNAISFATDGVHMGTADFGYLRNAMFVSTAVGALLLASIDVEATSALAWIWAATGVWISVRSAFGFARIWPGGGPWRSA